MFVILGWNVHETWFILSSVPGKFDSINGQNTFNCKGSSLSLDFLSFADLIWGPGKAASCDSSWLSMPGRVEQWRSKFTRLITVSETSVKNRHSWVLESEKKRSCYYHSNGPCWCRYWRHQLASHLSALLLYWNTSQGRVEFDKCPLPNILVCCVNVTLMTRMAWDGIFFWRVAFFMPPDITQICKMYRWHKGRK